MNDLEVAWGAERVGSDVPWAAVEEHLCLGDDHLKAAFVAWHRLVTSTSSLGVGLGRWRMLPLSPKSNSPLLEEKP